MSKRETSFEEDEEHLRTEYEFLDDKKIKRRILKH